MDLDARAWMFTDYYSISPGMVSQIPGKGAKYMIGFTDGAGTPLSGASSYRVNLPPKIPAANFWSVTLYTLPEASFFANPLERNLINSPMLPELARDADGGLTLWIQHADPGRGQRANWLPAPEGPFDLILRLYWPEPAALDGQWRAPSLQSRN